MVLELRVRLTYPQDLLDQPLIYRLIQQFGLLTNILEARVGPEGGWLVVAVHGEEEKVRQGLDWMAGQGVQVDFLDEEKEDP
mgnify:CR=1 FL=1